MSEIFPEPIRNLPQADIHIEGITSYLLQGEHQQVVFMSFDKDVSVPEHSHEAQWGVVVAGKVDLTIDGVGQTYSKGDSVFIPKGVKHSAKIHAGYADVSFFNEKDRYKVK